MNYVQKITLVSNVCMLMEVLLYNTIALALVTGILPVTVLAKSVTPAAWALAYETNVIEI